MNNLTDMLRSALKKRPVAAALDGCGDKKEGDEPTFDSANEYAETDLAVRSIASIHQWAETDDLDDGETYADRLVAQMSAWPMRTRMARSPTMSRKFCSPV